MTAVWIPMIILILVNFVSNSTALPVHPAIQGYNEHCIQGTEVHCTLYPGYTWYSVHWHPGYRGCLLLSLRSTRILTFFHRSYNKWQRSIHVTWPTPSTKGEPSFLPLNQLVVPASCELCDPDCGNERLKHVTYETPELDYTNGHIHKYIRWSGNLSFSVSKVWAWAHGDEEAVNLSRKILGVTMCEDAGVMWHLFKSGASYIIWCV